MKMFCYWTLYKNFELLVMEIMKIVGKRHVDFTDDKGCAVKGYSNDELLKAFVEAYVGASVEAAVNGYPSQSSLDTFNSLKAEIMDRIKK